MTEARISVIIPTRNRGSFLDEAIASVLAQSAPAWEIIVVDDGSTDGTADRFREPRNPVRYLRQSSGGPGSARNRGLEAASGDYIGFLDDDDLWPVGKTRQQLSHLLDDPGVAMVLGHTQRMVQRPAANGEFVFVPYKKPVRLFSLGCGLYRRSLFETVGKFDERLRFAEDDDWFMRCNELGIKSLFLPEVSQYYRFHDSNMTRDRQTKRQYLLHLAKNRMNRARARQEGLE
jgi:glycosyltransferase involved in cell wall biosynthesis